MSSADVLCGNLEGVFYDGRERVIKQGPHLVASEKSFEGYSKLGFDIVNLANNHTGDCGTPGFSSTIKLLNENDIKYVGYLDNKAEVC